MKTYRNLYPQVYAWDNLELAYRRARKGKRYHSNNNVGVRVGVFVP